jgi:hypothetical protein
MPPVSSNCRYKEEVEGKVVIVEEEEEQQQQQHQIVKVDI